MSDAALSLLESTSHPELASVLQHPALTRLKAPEIAPSVGCTWSLSALTGRLCELGPGAAPAVLSAAVALVRDAQKTGEPTAWVATGPDLFYPPDVVAAGVDLAALPVVRTTTCAAAGRAADLLLRSGAFGLVVVDLGGRGQSSVRANLDIPVQSRLVQLALKHEAAVLCLTDTPAGQSSLGSLVSLRAAASRRRVGPGRYTCEVTAIKDKRHGPGWRWQEVWRGPSGLE